MGGATVFPDLGIKAVWKSAVIRTTSGAKVSPPCYNLIYFHPMNYSYIMLYPPSNQLKGQLSHVEDLTSYLLYGEKKLWNKYCLEMTITLSETLRTYIDTYTST